MGLQLCKIIQAFRKLKTERSDVTIPQSSVDFTNDGGQNFVAGSEFSSMLTHTLFVEDSMKLDTVVTVVNMSMPTSSLPE